MLLTLLLSLFLVANPNENIQALLQEYAEKNEIVGAAVGYIDNGTVQFCTYGKKSILGEPITENTIFEIGSITKVFTTLALAERVTEGVMQLDDPIEKYLPNVRIPEFEGKKITLRHLATHTSALPRLPQNFNPENLSNPYQDYSTGDLYTYLSEYYLTYTPGSFFEYSNTGMALLGHILTLQSGKSFDELIHGLIFDNLNMKNTNTSLTGDDVACGYHLKQPVEHWDFAVFAGAGALRSNIQEMTRFLAANMGLSNSALTNLLKQCHQKQFEISQDDSIGLGWVITHSNDTEIIWHNGGTGGFKSYLGFNPKTSRGVVILSNSTDEWQEELGSVLLDPNFKRPLVL